MKRTPRGFAIYSEQTDANGQTVRVQESSTAAGPLVWIFCHDSEGRDAVMHLGKPLARSPHLTRSQARRLAKALLKFADRTP